MLIKLAATILTAGLMAAPLAFAIEEATAQTAQSEPAPPAKTVKKVKPAQTPSPAQLATRERQKKCGDEWKTAKAAGKADPTMKWPQYWSACNKRLKAGG